MNQTNHVNQFNQLLRPRGHLRLREGQKPTRSKVDGRPALGHAQNTVLKNRNRLILIHKL